MALRFEIVTRLDLFFDAFVDLKLNEDVDIFIEYFNSNEKFYYKKMNPQNYQSKEFNHLDYKGFFMISKEIDFNGLVNPFEDSIFPYAVEILGGRETKDEIELLKLRQIAKSPNETINRAYQKLQRYFKSHERIEKGVYYGTQFYKNIYFDNSISKTIFYSFDNKTHEIKLK